ncbi:class I SAM-dependent methyltransferase [Paenibacillus xerothermodurans]|uniref:class I SAM-dependent methyltransferase n=1 Tax=Paenibacillus xerothermodurans TaxID=1977292 RepID=UPI001FB35876|nr:methyltransferase domain-containing protein [Paenibacillus xerothermodurans]
MESNVARNRAELSGKATNILDSRTLTSSHKRLAELITEGMTVLDVGCGTGAITRGITEIVGPTGRAVGIDSNPALIEKAKQNFGDTPGLNFEVGDIFNLPYKDEFDLVTSARVLQWLSNPFEALNALKCATKPGGQVLILDYNHEKITWNPEPPLSMKSFYSAFLKWRSDAGMDNAIADHLKLI